MTKNFILDIVLPSKMKFSITHVDHIQLAAPQKSEKLARHFFGDILQMKEISKPESLKQRGGVWFECGKQQLHIGIQKDFLPAKKAHPAFYVNNLNDLYEKMKLNGFDVEKHELLPNMNRFYVHDPFGNRLEFLEHM